MSITDSARSTGYLLLAAALLLCATLVWEIGTVPLIGIACLVGATVCWWRMLQSGAGHRYRRIDRHQLSE